MVIIRKFIKVVYDYDISEDKSKIMRTSGGC